MAKRIFKASSVGEGGARRRGRFLKLCSFLSTGKLSLIWYTFFFLVVY